MIKLLLMLLLALVAGSAHAQSLDLEAIAKQPGTEVIRRSEDGSKVLEVRRGTVTWELKDGTIVGFDSSPHGAVLCAWEIIVGMKTVMDVCFPGEFPEASSLLGEEIEALDDFIVANSVTPMTKADLRARFDERLRDVKPGSGTCRAVRQGFIEPLAALLQSTPRAEVRRKFDQTLAVPRPPVMNPCL
jgi:hypothetical protein